MELLSRRRTRHVLGAHTHGFTLIEMAVVILVMSLLAGVGVTVFVKQKNKGYMAGVSSDARNIGAAIEGARKNNSDPYAPVLDNKGTQVGALLSPGNILAQYVRDDVGGFRFCVIHVSEQTIDAWAIYSSLSGGMVNQGTKDNPSECSPALAQPVGETPTPMPTPQVPGPTSGPPPPGPTGGPAPSDPSVPQSVRATAVPGEARATIDWDVVAGADRYSIYLDGAATPIWTGTALTTVLTAIASGPHDVTVTSTTGGDESPRSEHADFTIYGDNDFIRFAHPIEANQPGIPWDTRDYDSTPGTVETGEPSGSDTSSAFQSYWWAFTAKRTATYNFRVAQASDGSTRYTYPQMVVWETQATVVTDLPAIPLAATKNSIRDFVTIAAVEGTTYKVRVSAMSTGTNYKGKFRLRVAPGPGNDSLVDAYEVSGLSSDTPWRSFDVNNTYADGQTGEPADHWGGMWWTMTAPRSATYTVRVIQAADGSPLYTYPKIYAWVTNTTNVAALGTPIALQNNTANVIRFPALAGETIKIRASTANSETVNYRTAFRLQITPGPSNDHLENAAPVGPVDAGIPWLSPDVTNMNAEAETGEPAGGGGGQWWTFTAPRAATYNMLVVAAASGVPLYSYPQVRVWKVNTTDVATLGTSVAAYTGSGTPQVNVAALAGDVFKIRISSMSDNPGWRSAYRLRVAG